MTGRTDEIADLQARIIRGYSAEFTPGIMAMSAVNVAVPFVSLIILLFWGW